LPDSSTRVILELDDGSHLYFNDQRKFGWMRLMPAEAVESVPFIAKLGAEPQLSNSHAQWDSVQLEMVMSAPDDEPTHPTTPVTPAEASFLYRARRHPRALIKSVLLDQSVVGGIGNIYADESLWMAKVHPETRVADLHDHELLNIWGAAASVMALSVELGGSTDRNYVNAKGERGAYLDFANVFRREGRPCKRCQKYPIHPRIIKIRVAGRGTHICIRCQELRGVTSFRVE
jgi:formamidopyrimidine-DNA glycosylase